MANIVKKKKTTGPFPVPLGQVVGLHEVDFQTYNEYCHDDNLECSQWTVENMKHVKIEKNSDLSVCGPFSRLDGSIYYTCQKKNVR